MDKKSFKITALVLASIMLVGSSFATFATATDTTNQNKEQREFKRPENEIFGKITAINANSVTISVATRKEMEKPPERPQGNNQNGNRPEKPEGDNGNTPPEKPQGDKQDGTRPERPNMDDMFTLTGETKTINISNAEFESGFGHRRGGKDGQNDTNTADNSNETKKTYADFSVGDYISIEATDSTYATAKIVRGAFGGGPRGFGGKKQDNNTTN